MTMLTHTSDPIEPVPYSAGNQDPAKARAAAACLAAVKRLFMRALTVVAAAVTVTAIMALKIAIYLPRFIHH